MKGELFTSGTPFEMSNSRGNLRRLSRWNHPQTATAQYSLTSSQSIRFLEVLHQVASFRIPSMTFVMS
jgi:hypothetical protein